MGILYDTIYESKNLSEAPAEMVKKKDTLNVGDIFTSEESFGTARWKVIDVNNKNEALYIPINDVAEIVCREVGEPLTYWPIESLLKHALKECDIQTVNEGVFRHMVDIILCDSWGSEASRVVVEDTSEDIMRGIASLYPQVGDIIKIEAGEHEDNSI